jgi:hypothetical protein
MVGGENQSRSRRSAAPPPFAGTMDQNPNCMVVDYLVNSGEDPEKLAVALSGTSFKAKQ